MYFSESSLDDLMNKVIGTILSSGVKVTSTKGDSKEIFGVLLELRKPHARLSRTETRGRVFSCLGELLWYLAKSNKLEFIKHYISRYEEFAEDGELYGAYGPRIFGSEKFANQYANIKDILTRKQGSRQAVLQIIDGKDILVGTKDVPCTCTLQFVRRGKKLHMMVHMRSNDVMLGLPHDVFCFTMLQEILARDLGLRVGVYKHSVASLHIYDDAIEKAKQYCLEGWQETIAMPEMPKGDPWPAIEAVLAAEEKIRLGEEFDISTLSLDEYWLDLIRLLQIVSTVNSKDYRKVVRIKESMSSSVYEQYIRQRIKTKKLQPLLDV